MRVFGGWGIYIYCVALKLYGWELGFCDRPISCARVRHFDASELGSRLNARISCRKWLSRGLCLKFSGASALCCDIPLAISCTKTVS